MPKIENWSKVDEPTNGAVMQWVHDNKESKVEVRGGKPVFDLGKTNYRVKYSYKKPEGSRRPSLGKDDVGVITVKRNISDKSEARKVAVNWMRKHPKGAFE